MSGRAGSAPGPGRRRTESAVLYLSMFVLGSCGMAYEYTFSKTASDLLGNSARQWALVIGLMMLFMGIGADAQKHLKDEGLLDKFVLFEILLGGIGGTGALLLLWVFGRDPLHYAVFQYGLVIATGFLIGLEIPIVTRLNEVYSESLRINLGAVLKMDYLGSFVGSLAWVFLLPRWFSMVETGLVLGLLNLVVVFFTLFFFRPYLRRFQALWIGSLAALIAVGLLFVNARGLTSYAEQYLYRNRVVLSRTTTYQHIVVTESPAGRIDCFINGNIQFSSLDEHIYHEWLVHPAMELAGHPPEVLILGGGDGLALREVLKYSGVRRVVLCDLDPEMTRLAAEHPLFRELNDDSLNRKRVQVMSNDIVQPGPEQSVRQNSLQPGLHREPGDLPAVRVMNLDAMKFLERVPDRFGLIIADFPDPNSRELAKLYSREFYRLVGDHLSPGGLFVQQSTSPSFAREAFLCIGRTLRAAGFHAVPVQDHVPSFGNWGWWLASRLPEQVLRDQLETMGDPPVPTRYLTGPVIRAGLVFGRGELDTDDATVSSLTNDHIYALYIRGWQNAYP